MTFIGLNLGFLIQYYPNQSASAADRLWTSGQTIQPPDDSITGNNQRACEKGVVVYLVGQVSMNEETIGSGS